MEFDLDLDLEDLNLKKKRRKDNIEKYQEEKEDIIDKEESKTKMALNFFLAFLCCLIGERVCVIIIRRPEQARNDLYQLFLCSCRSNLFSIDPMMGFLTISEKSNLCIAMPSIPESISVIV